ncbi:uncharacterized protein A4U43_C08F23100 [Asparagus officinalis]|nr:uncharacterized protein A4U43_C08F23100 [Asparagus officinalis]
MRTPCTEKSSVIVDGTKFVSPHVFLRQKEAKQNAAKLALDGVLSKMKLDGISLIPNDTTFCKTILHEYAAKMNLELPRYTTSKSGAHFSTFITSVFFDGKTYKGVPARSKRDAEQLGARTVVDWILGKSDRSIVMAEIIKSKGKFFDAFSSGNGSFVPHDDVMPLKMTLDYQHGSIAASEKDMHSGSTAPQNNIVLLNASFANHPGYRNSKENNMHVLSRSSNLPVHAAVHPTLPAMVENAKGKIRQWKNQLQGSTNGHLYYVISEFCPPQGNIFCKSILHEYAAKMRMGLSTYTTSQLAGLFPTFISSVVFDRKMYVGGPGKSKQEAKQFGARTVIDRKLGESDMSTVMTEVIKSKGILVDAFNRGSDSIVPQDNNMPLKLTLANHSGYTAPFENGMHVLPTNGNLPGFHKLIFSLDNIFYKSILHEYAAKMRIAKMRMGLPTYTTSQLAGLFPTFISSVVFDGKMYVGGPGRSKQEAEQFGARTVIDRILGESDMSTVMTEVIKSKDILVDAFNRGSGSIVPQDDKPLKLVLDNHDGYTAPLKMACMFYQQMAISQFLQQIALYYLLYKTPKEKL